MTRIEALKQLAEKVENASDIWPSDFPKGFRHVPRAIHAFEGSLDAAKALHEAVLPGVKVRIFDHGENDVDIGQWNVKINWERMEWQPTFTAAGPFGYSATSNNPARAWLLAILKALIAQEERT